MLGGDGWPNLGIGRIIGVIGGHKLFSYLDWPPAPKHISCIKKFATLKLVQTTESSINRC